MLGIKNLLTSINKQQIIDKAKSTQVVAKAVCKSTSGVIQDEFVHTVKKLKPKNYADMKEKCAKFFDKALTDFTENIHKMKFMS